MTVYEIIETHKHLFGLMASNGLSIQDVKHLEMYKEFERLRGDGVKVRYAAAVMASQYNMTERSVFRIVEKFGKILAL